MPNVSIQGKKYERVNSAQVQISHGDSMEALQIPVQQFVINVPLDHDTTIAEWALAPHGPKRWKTVELQTLDRSDKVNHTWTLHKAYVHSMREVEFAPQSGEDNVIGNSLEIVVRGVLLHNNVAYDGKNILTVAAGEAEPEPS
jgi:hypothetical protein